MIKNFIVIARQNDTTKMSRNKKNRRNVIRLRQRCNYYKITIKAFDQNSGKSY